MEKLIKVHAVFVVALKQGQEQLSQRGRGLPGDGGDQRLVLLVEEAEVLGAAKHCRRQCNFNIYLFQKKKSVKSLCTKCLWYVISVKSKSPTK